MPERSTPETLQLFWRDRSRWEAPRSSGPTTAWPSRALRVIRGVNAGPPSASCCDRAASRRGTTQAARSPRAASRPAETIKLNYAAPDSSAPTREPEMPERSTPETLQLFWRDRSRWEAPRSSGPTTAWPSRALRVIRGVNAGPPSASCCDRAASRRGTTQAARSPRAASRPAETIKLNYAAPDSSAPTREPEMPERSTPETLQLFWRDRSRWEAPRSSGPTTAWPSRALRVIRGVNAGPPQPAVAIVRPAAAAPPRRPDRLEPHRGQPKPLNLTTPRQILRHPRASPKCRRGARPRPFQLFWRDRSRWEAPRSSGPTTAWPSRALRVIRGVNAGPPQPAVAIVRPAAAAPPRRPDRLEPHRGQPKPLNLTTPRQILRHPRASPKCRRGARPRPSSCFGATDRVGKHPVAAGRPRPGPRAR